MQSPPRSFAIFSVLNILLLICHLRTCSSASAWPEGTPVATRTNPLRLLTILGDSYSDLGKSRDAEISLFKLSGGRLFDPKVFPERQFGTGLNWGGQLHTMIPDLHIRSYAVAAATACSIHSYSIVNPASSTSLPNIPSIQEQAAMYLEDAKTRVFSQRRAVAIWAGTNDIFAGIMDDPDGPEGPELPVLLSQTEKLIDETVSCIVGVVHALVAAGERRVIVFALNPLEDLPRMAPLADFLLEKVVPLFNLKLEATLDLVQSDFIEAKIEVFDVYPRLKAAKEHPTKAGLKNVTDPCIEPKKPHEMSANPYKHKRKACDDPDSHLFFDPVHYSTNVQRNVIARGLVQYLSDRGYVEECNEKTCKASA